jgi:hypothetical protein
MPLDNQKKRCKGISPPLWGDLAFLLTVGDLKMLLVLSQIPKENFSIDFNPIFNNKNLSIYKNLINKVCVELIFTSNDVKINVYFIESMGFL